MSRSYTSKDGLRVEVSKDHLDTAILIKEELQKASPSRRASWAKHKRMMEAEGYDDSENSESYRQMIKLEQGARGILPSVEKHADMVVTSKIEAIKSEIGEIRSSKLEAQLEFNKLNKMKREWTKDILLVEAIENALKEKDFGKPIDFAPVYVESLPKKQMIACISDLHYGSVVDVEDYLYNTEIAERLLMEYADKVIAIAEENNVDFVYVINLGDAIEHLYMRSQNTYGANRTLEEQITEVSDLIISFIQKLSKYVKVAYSGINGNHDRLQGDKSLNVYSDGAIGISNKIIETFVKYGNNDKVTYVDAEPYHHIISMNSKNFLFVHGDQTPLARKTILAEQSMLYGINFDAIFGGHIHHFTSKEVAENKYVVTFGSIKGSDEYSLKTIGSTASRSQGVILVDEFGNFEIKQVKL